MPIQVRWADEQQTITEFIFVSPWTTDEFRTARAQAKQMADTVSHDVHVLADFTENYGMLPSDALSTFRHAAQDVHPRWISLVIISRRARFARAIFGLLERLTKVTVRTYFVASQAEAQQLFADFHLITDPRRLN